MYLVVKSEENEIEKRRKISQNNYYLIREMLSKKWVERESKWNFFLIVLQCKHKFEWHKIMYIFFAR